MVILSYLCLSAYRPTVIAPVSNVGNNYEPTVDEVNKTSAEQNKTDIFMFFIFSPCFEGLPFGQWSESMCLYL